MNGECDNCGSVKDIGRFQDKESELPYLCYYCKRIKYRKGQNLRMRAETKREYSKKHYMENRAYYYEHNKKWRKEHPERMREFARKHNLKVSKDIKRRLSSSISGGMRHSLGRKKNGYHWENLVNYTIEQLKSWLEKQFVDGMSLENYGKWHIHHIIPISFFQYNSFNDTEFRMCWRLENLKPLWAVDNLKHKKKVLLRKVG